MSLGTAWMKGSVLINELFPIFETCSNVGAIIYWGLIRFALVLVGAWVLYNFMPNYSDWWTLFFVAVGLVVVYPAQLAWRKHVETVRHASRNGLCATCRHFAAEETLCT